MVLGFKVKVLYRWGARRQISTFRGLWNAYCGGGGGVCFERAVSGLRGLRFRV